MEEGCSSRVVSIEQHGHSRSKQSAAPVRRQWRRHHRGNCSGASSIGNSASRSSGDNAAATASPAPSLSHTCATLVFRLPTPNARPLTGSKRRTQRAAAASCARHHMVHAAQPLSRRCFEARRTPQSETSRDAAGPDAKKPALLALSCSSCRRRASLASSSMSYDSRSSREGNSSVSTCRGCQAGGCRRVMHQLAVARSRSSAAGSSSAQHQLPSSINYKQQQQQRQQRRTTTTISS